MWVFWNAWHSTGFVNHNSDLCQIWERVLGRATFFKICSCFSRQNKYGFDFHVIFEAVFCSCLCVVLWHQNLWRSFLGTVQAELECHLILVVKLESFKGSPQVQVDGRKLFPGKKPVLPLSWVSQCLWNCCGNQSHSKSWSFICVCTFKIRELFLSLWKRFYLLNLDFSKKNLTLPCWLSPVFCQ